MKKLPSKAHAFEGSFYFFHAVSNAKCCVQIPHYNLLCQHSMQNYSNFRTGDLLTRI